MNLGPNPDISGDIGAIRSKRAYAARGSKTRPAGPKVPYDRSGAAESNPRVLKDFRPPPRYVMGSDSRVAIFGHPGLKPCALAN